MHKFNCGLEPSVCPQFWEQHHIYILSFIPPNNQQFQGDAAIFNY